jgi:hypothetical protein
MPWKLSGEMYESCSCKMICSCTVGPAEPDQGWCSVAQVVRISEGESDGVDLSGATVAVGLELPGDFFSGIDKARLYVDGSDEQRTELEQIFHGHKGGVWAAINESVREWLPTKAAAITITDEPTPTVEVEAAGRLELAPMKTESGEQAQLVNAPVVANFQIQTVNLHQAMGSKWADPDLRAWESLGYGGKSPISWAS